MKLDDIKKLQQKKYRSELGACLVEGEHLVLELQQVLQLRPELQAAELYLTEEYRDWPTPLVKHEIGSKQMRALSATKSPQGILAVLPIDAIRPASADGDIAIYLHEVQDPGNLGTILRTLAWFGGFRCLLSPNSVDPFNPKVIRASMGAIFHVPLELDVPLESLAERYKRIGCLDMQGEPLSAPTFSECDCYLFGNEARGVPREQLDSLSACPFTITGSGQIESLNLATAVSLSVYERRR
ncbi:TrmH family RNA methyltransferase [Marinobacterium iners]|uniref:RNA methyltransferase, TrmH family n=1 Tax=Marinobacterium iners DSM 11526 TaxID=1122198 RepID=A0A1H4GGR2_9GAMM|nr:RNA methyltransferase [Marinobacterium iners]SEB08815.1 RNA methyltransferase, TrmH family [Marinobacterium iners DSM 11526]